MSRGPDGNSAHISQDFHLLELAPSPRGGVAGVSSGQSLHPSGCGSYVAAEYTAALLARLQGLCDVAGTLRRGGTMAERASEMVPEADPREAEAAQTRPSRSAGRADA